MYHVQFPGYNPKLFDIKKKNNNRKMWLIVKKQSRETDFEMTQNLEILDNNFKSSMILKTN